MGIFADEAKQWMPSYETIDQLNESTILEAYFGDGVVSHIQAQFSKFRSKYIGKQSWNTKINYDPDLIKFNRLVEEQFGYYRFCLMVAPTYDYNAFMLNVGWLAGDGADDLYFKNLKVYKSNKGFKYDKEAKVSAISNIYYGLITDANFTDREVFSIMLHEIGHSFTYSVLNRNGVLGGSSFLTNIIKSINGLVKKSIEDGIEITPDQADKNLNGIGIFNKLGLFFTSKKSVFKNVFHSVSNTMSGMKKNAKHYDYTNEKFADTFASMYGYSSDVQTGLQKVGGLYDKFYKSDKEKIPGHLSVIMKVGMLSLNNLLEYAFNLKDEHPDGLARIKTQVDYLERELRNTAIDPKVKIALQQHLDEQRKLIDEFLENAKVPGARQAYNIYYAKLYNKYGGDIREKVTDNQAMFDTIDKRIEDVTNESVNVIESDMEDFWSSSL